ncbi:PucR family transcriptional regulator [Anaerosacchariphilus polymeriproducens]|uniref:PucR family transcriptional regulator n=1 Tax=Anaerosacchariphilus polymeriproducens TaxID=1812858 RepID=A0A371AS11_9FIRM|nr:PucR family transcriptional regulator [Anaerosacchariphilus polymeriproducens]
MKALSQENKLNQALKELYNVTGLQFSLLSNPELDTKQALEQIKHLTHAYREKYNKSGFIQELLIEELSSSDIFYRAQKLHIEFHAKRAVYIIETKNAKDSTLLETLKNLFTNLTDDFIIEFSPNNIILVKTFYSKKSKVELEQTANTIVDMLNTEAMSKVRVGYSSIIEDLSQLIIAYKEARLALDIGNLFYTNKATHCHSSLGLGRIIYHLPESLSTTFLKEILGTDPLNSIDEETLTTINIFFDNGLNIAETARKLYIHRNTLIYRIEKLQKLTGLDIRSFDDAVLIKIALMIIRHLKSR